jgi:hypothetical protein
MQSSDDCCNAAVIPAKAGIQRLASERLWVPAFAGTTVLMECVDTHGFGSSRAAHGARCRRSRGSSAWLRPGFPSDPEGYAAYRKSLTAPRFFFDPSADLSKTLGRAGGAAPVDGEFTCEAGQTIWGFPKFMSEIAIIHGRGLQTAVLQVDGQHVLTQSVRTGGSRTMPERDQISYALRDGTLYRTRAQMRGTGMGVRLGGAKLELGDHPIADELRTLGLPKRALASSSIAHMSATFYAATRSEVHR